MQPQEQINRRLKLRHLLVLIEVVRWGSMARAAEHLAMSQPVISKTIADLERTVGVRLLDRSRQGAEPTLYGRALLRRSVAIFNDLRSSMSELESLADPSAGELRIGSTEPLMAGLLSAIVYRLSQQHPRLALHITEGDPPDLQDRHLRDHDIDLMIGRLPSETPAPDTDVQVLLHEKGMVVAGSENKWVRRRKINLAELLTEPWCLPPPESFPGGWIAKAFHDRGLEVPRASVTVHSIHMQQVLLSTGRFLAIQPATLLHFSAKRLPIKALAVDLSTSMWPIGIITLRNRTLNPAAQLFIDCARQLSKPFAGETPRRAAG
jgi:DNA-binding transcriptional LysR family regulator